MGEQAPPAARTCGFFPPAGTVVTEAALRTMIVNAAVASLTGWRVAGAPARLECDAAVFGHLLVYTLSFHIERSDDVFPLQVAAGRLTGPGTTAAGLIRTASRTSSPALEGAVGTSITAATSSQSNATPWSAYWVTFVVRAAAIGLGLENPTHGRDGLLKRSTGHREYTVEAHRRTTRGQTGTYHAFDPTSRAPQVGDIIVTDRQPTLPRSLLTFARIASLSAPRKTHGDIVIAVDTTNRRVVTLGGNVDDSVRRRHYPLDAQGRLVVNERQRYTQEDHYAAVPRLPDRTCPDPEELHDRNTLRIFALLSPVPECRP